METNKTKDITNSAVIFDGLIKNSKTIKVNTLPGFYTVIRLGQIYHHVSSLEGTTIYTSILNSYSDDKYIAIYNITNKDIGGRWGTHIEFMDDGTPITKFIRASFTFRINHGERLLRQISCQDDFTINDSISLIRTLIDNYAKPLYRNYLIKEKDHKDYDIDGIMLKSLNQDVLCKYGVELVEYYSVIEDK